MSNCEQKEPVAPDASASLAATATVEVGHDGDGAMGTRSMTVGRYEEIRRRLADGRGVREIARALNCSRDTVREVRDGRRNSPDAPKACADPLWMLQLDWLQSFTIWDSAIH